MEISSQLLSPRFWVEYALDFGAREPAHLTIELLCIGLIGYLIFSKQYKPNEIKPLSRKEEDAIIADWTPEPMVPETFQNNHSTDPFLIVDSSADAVVTSEGKEYLNLASHNFLGFANNQMIKDKCAETINKYGVGSCGPRGFYGTLPPHSELERTFANFLGVSDSILYSDSMACMSSVIPAFAKTGDIIVSDEHVNNGIQCGLKLSRSRICFFKHNDLADLEKLLADIADKAERATNKTRAETHRRFITIEGIYQYTGSVTNLKAVVALAKKYRFRIILDDTLALGVLGATGRGSCEHWGVSIGDDVAIVCASLDAAVASVGGLCVGSPAIVSHQRLSGSGYCFSASSTPYSATAGSLGLGLINANPQLPALARSRAEFLRQQLRSATSSLPLVLSGDAESPVTHVRLGAAWPYDASASGSGSPTAASTAAAGADNTAAAMAVLWRVAERLKEEGIIAVPATYLPTETLCPPPSLRLCVSTHHAEEDLVAAAKAIGKAFAAELQRK